MRKLINVMPRGITRRWLLNSVAVVLIATIICVVGFISLARRVYYSDMEDSLYRAAEKVVNYAESTDRRADEMQTIAKARVVLPEDPNIALEYQFLTMRDGYIYIEESSIGYVLQEPLTSNDAAAAFKTGDKGVGYGRNQLTNERVIYATKALKNNGEVIGAVRCVSGLEELNSQILVMSFVAVATGVAVILLVLFTNTFFIRSVVRPINEITNMARRIADGSYGIQIPQHYTDEIAEMVDSINEMSVKISQAEKAQTEFMSSISHELRTPLTAISGWGETLMYDENQSEESKKGLAIILKESHRLTKMVEELLEFTRMQDGRFTLNAEMIDVGAELEETIFSYREVLRQYNMSLEYDPCMQDLPMIYADPERLRQVFLNILDNANKYGRDGGRIIVSVRLDASYITVRFRDFGPGIPEDQLDHVKEKFFKGDNTKRGSGIGLAVCDEIINYHGGSLTLANANGGGCLVTIRLPIKMTVREDNPDDRQ